MKYNIRVQRSALDDGIHTRIHASSLEVCLSCYECERLICRFGASWELVFAPSASSPGLSLAHARSDCYRFSRHTSVNRHLMMLWYTRNKLKVIGRSRDIVCGGCSLTRFAAHTNPVLETVTPYRFAREHCDSFKRLGTRRTSCRGDESRVRSIMSTSVIVHV